MNLLKKLTHQSWHRGTRENDLLLGLFADEVLPTLSREELKPMKICCSWGRWPICLDYGQATNSKWWSDGSSYLGISSMSMNQVYAGIPEGLNSLIMPSIFGQKRSLYICATKLKPKDLLSKFHCSTPYTSLIFSSLGLFALWSGLIWARCHDNE